MDRLNTGVFQYSNDGFEHWFFGKMPKEPVGLCINILIITCVNSMCNQVFIQRVKSTPVQLP